MPKWEINPGFRLHASWRHTDDPCVSARKDSNRSIAPVLCAADSIIRTPATSAARQQLPRQSHDRVEPPPKQHHNPCRLKRQWQTRQTTARQGFEAAAGSSIYTTLEFNRRRRRSAGMSCWAAVGPCWDNDLTQFQGDTYCCPPNERSIGASSAHRGR